MQYADFIESQMTKHPNDDITFAYKRSVLDAMEKRSRQLRKRGLTDEKVIRELVCSENEAIEAGYFAYLKKEKKKKQIRALPRNIPIYMIALVLAYLITGFASGIWHPTWLIIEVGVSVMVVYLLLFAADLIAKTPLYPLARLCTAGSVMVTAQFLFLLLRIPLGLEKSYLLFLAAVGFMLISDGILASATKQKFAFLSWLVYIPASMGVFYPLLALTGVIPWNPGWMLMVAAAALDLLLVLGTVLYKGSFTVRQELENIWKED